MDGDDPFTFQPNSCEIVFSKNSCQLSVISKEGFVTDKTSVTATHFQDLRTVPAGEV